MKKFNKAWYGSDPARPNKFDSFMKNAKTVCTEAELNG